MTSKVPFSEEASIGFDLNFVGDGQTVSGQGMVRWSAARDQLDRNRNNTSQRTGAGLVRWSRPLKPDGFLHSTIYLNEHRSPQPRNPRCRTIIARTELANRYLARNYVCWSASTSIKIVSTVSASMEVMATPKEGI